MFKNHLLFSFRLFFKDRFYSILNIAGLALGITTGIVLLLILQYDLNFDKHHEKYDRIYRYVQKMEAPGAVFDVAVSGAELTPVFYQELPEVESIVRILDYPDPLVRHVSSDGVITQFKEDDVIRADSTLFTVFTHKILQGNKEKALRGFNKAVLTSSTAERYFGDKDALGEVLMMPDSQLYEVSAIIEDFPENSHVKYDMILSGIPSRNPKDDMQLSEAYWNPQVYTYLLFNEGVDPEFFYDRFPVIYDKTYKLFGDKIGGKVTPLLEPLADIHFHSTKIADYPQGDIKFVYGSAAIGLFIILLACINYMNMSTARASRRTAEMAMRKVLGLSRTRLFFTVLSEALIMSLIAMIVAVFLSYYVIEFSGFTSLIQRKLEMNLVENVTLLSGMLLMTLVIGIVSGIYPALYIPSIPVINALKGNKSIKLSGGWLRKVLIGFQFFLSLIVIISTIIMGKQIEFLQDKDMGFDRNNLLFLPLPEYRENQNIEAFNNRLLENPDIISVTSSSTAPNNIQDFQVLKVENDEQGSVQQRFNSLRVGDDFLKTMGLTLVKGRDFISGNVSDHNVSFIINEAAVRELGWEDDPIGKRMSYFHAKDWGKVIGVVKDFNHASLHTSIQPVVIAHTGNNINDIMMVKLSGENISGALEFVRKTWSELMPSHPFEYEFMDQSLYEQYKSDQIQLQLIQILSFICIFISILGLIGLSAFTASQKTKEIGIRKSLGATVPQIVLLFSKDYLKLIIMAFIVAVPVANYIVTEWMRSFAYQMDMRYYYFLIPGLLIMLLALATVSIQSWKASKANPVHALSHE